MHKNLLFLVPFILIGLVGKAQMPLTNTNWYLIQIEENNQFYNVPLSSNGTTSGNWHFQILSPASEEENAILSSNYCSSFSGPVTITSTSFNFYQGQIALTLNLPCEWMTPEEIQYFNKYYVFFENYRNDTFSYIIQDNILGYSQLTITNDAGNKAYYSTIPLRTASFEEREMELTIYPNPTTDELFIKVPENVQLQSVRIFNIEGKEIQKEHRSSINISAFNTGIYFLEIEINGTIYYRKFIKK